MRTFILMSAVLLSAMAVDASSALAMGKDRAIDSPFFQAQGPCLVAKQKAVEVPELDPNAAGGALALLLGGAAILAGRRRGASD